MVGYVAPGATGAWQPELPTAYAPEVAPSPTATGIANYNPGVPGQTGTGTSYGVTPIRDLPPTGTDAVSGNPDDLFGGGGSVADVPIGGRVASGVNAASLVNTASAGGSPPWWVFAGVGVALLVALKGRR